MLSTSQRLGLNSLLPIEERRRHRRILAPVEVYKVLAGADAWRFHYGIAHAVAHGEIWAPWLGDTLSFLSLPEGDVLCVWPHEALGISASRGYRNPVSIDPVPLDIWIDTFLDTELRREGIKVVICPSERSGNVISIDDVLREIAQCVEDQQAYWQTHFAADEFVPITSGCPIGKLGK